MTKINFFTNISKDFNVYTRLIVKLDRKAFIIKKQFKTHIMAKVNQGTNKVSQNTLFMIYALVIVMAIVVTVLTTS